MMKNVILATILLVGFCSGQLISECVDNVLVRAQVCFSYPACIKRHHQPRDDLAECQEYADNACCTREDTETVLKTQADRQFSEKCWRFYRMHYCGFECSPDYAKAQANGTP